MLLNLYISIDNTLNTQLFSWKMLELKFIWRYCNEGVFFNVSYLNTVIYAALCCRANLNCEKKPNPTQTDATEFS